MFIQSCLLLLNIVVMISLCAAHLLQVTHYYNLPTSYVMGTVRGAAYVV